MEQRARKTRHLVAAAAFVLLSLLMGPAVLADTRGTGALVLDPGATATVLVQLQQSIYATKTAIAATATTIAELTTTATPIRLTLTSTPLPLTATPTPAPSTPTSTRTPKPSPTPAPNVEIVAARINIRSGPGTSFSVLGMAQAGQRFLVLQEAGDCTWLRILLDDGAEGWVAGAASLTRLDVPCATLQSAGDTSEPVAAIATPTSSPLPRRSATPTPARAGATNTPTPLPPAPTRRPDSGGPSSIAIISPGDGYSSPAPVAFAWTADAPLAPGQEFEVVFWNAGSETEAQGRGWVRSGPETSVRIDPSRQAAGAYRWGVYLVTSEPYQRLRYLGGGLLLTVPGEGGGGGTGPESTPIGQK